MKIQNKIFSPSSSFVCKEDLCAHPASFSFVYRIIMIMTNIGALLNRIFSITLSHVYLLLASVFLAIPRHSTIWWLFFPRVIPLLYIHLFQINSLPVFHHRCWWFSCLRSRTTFPFFIDGWFLVSFASVNTVGVLLPLIIISIYCRKYFVEISKNWEVNFIDPALYRVYLIFFLAIYFIW